MLVKFNTTELNDSTLDELKDHFNVGTASKACSFASANYMILHSSMIQQSKLAQEYLRRLEIIQQSLESKEVADYEIKQALIFKE
jgi:hypothetical protein